MIIEERSPVVHEIHARLTAAFAPARLVVSNDSAKHRGHAGDDGSGESHFSIVIAAASFAGLSRVAQQRLIYGALGTLMTDRIHALAIKVSAV
jgi:BolA protein